MVDFKEKDPTSEPVWNPLCITQDREVAASCLGYLMPCCWIDPIYAHKKIQNPLLAGLFTEDLKVENNDSIDDILASEEWFNFFKSLIDGPETAPEVCRRYCYRAGGQEIKATIKT